MDRWPAVAAHLATHHGVIDRDALDRLGVGRGQLAHWVATGRLERRAPRVWKLAGAPDTWELRLATGLLTLGPEATVSHMAAAALHRLDRATPGALEFMVPRGSRRPARFDGAVHSTRDLRRTDVLQVAGFRATSPTRTILDLGSLGTDDDTLAAMIDSAVRLRVSSPVVLLRRLTALRRRGRAGVRQVERLLVDAGGESLLERQFLKLVRAAGLPRPITQARIAAHGQQVARVDFLYAEHALVVEVSGRVGHSSPADRARDAQRRNELQAEGFTVYEFTFEHVTRRPEWVVAQLSARLGRP